MLDPKDEGVQFLADGYREKPKDMLISCEPYLVGRIRHGFLVVVVILYLQILGRRDVSAVEQAEKTRSSEGGHDLSRPEQKIVPSQFFQRWRSKVGQHNRSQRRHGGGDRGFEGGREAIKRSDRRLVFVWGIGF